MFGGGGGLDFVFFFFLLLGGGGCEGEVEEDLLLTILRSSGLVGGI